MTKNSKTFHGQLLVITSAGSGIGRETALAFTRCGAAVVLSDANLDAAKQTAAIIDEAGGTAHAYQLDVADEAAVHAHADDVVEKHGVPDILTTTRASDRPARSWTPRRSRWTSTRGTEELPTFFAATSSAAKRLGPVSPSTATASKSKPLGLEFYIGLPASVDRDWVAHLHGYSRGEMLLHLNTMPPRFVAALLNPFGLTARTLVNPKGIGDLDAYNREEVRVVKIPAANGIGTARSVAKAYGCVATGGSDLGLTQSTLDALAESAIAPTKGLRDKVLHVDTAFSLG
jgi:Enoyl-(Acyl carrier protein) reductase